ncbi:MAG: anti-sigma factor [Cyclobacteriaceae bacterium]|nr:MAG: anti-sigma factor [Cyclobacteriaceae bacterium]
MEQEKIYKIISKHLSGESTREEAQLLDQWVNTSEENRSYLAELTRIWDTSGRMHLDLDLDLETAWDKVSHRAQEVETKVEVRPLHGFLIYKVAASLLVLLALGGLFYKFLNNQEATVYQTDANQRMQVILPDNSEVWLNQNSKLEVGGDFDQERHLALTGEAFFEVEHDPARPFTVKSEELLTTVVGTSFNVTARKNQLQQEVEVSTGKVQVSYEGKDQSVLVLEPGTKAIFDRSSQQLKKDTNQDLNFLAWKDRRLRFRNAPLLQVESVLEDYFNVDLRFNQASLGQCQFTGDFEDPTIVEVLEVLAMTLDLDYTLNNGSYLLEGDGCKLTGN